MRRQRRRRPMKGECHRKALEDEFGAHEWAGRRNAGRIGRGRRRWRPSGKLGNYRRMALRMPRPATFFGDDVADSFATSNRLSGERIRELESSLKTKWRRKMPLCTHEETRRLRDEQQFSDGSCGNLGFFSLLFRSCDTPIRREGGKVTPPPPPTSPSSRRSCVCGRISNAKKESNATTDDGGGGTTSTNTCNILHVQSLQLQILRLCTNRSHSELNVK
jgi:hypothetical protein